MSDPTVAPQTSRPRGRRARRLAEDPQAGSAAAPQSPSVPRVRGAVASPTADAPKPSLRRYGRRARIIELDEQPAPERAPSAQEAPGKDAHAAAFPSTSNAARTDAAAAQQLGTAAAQSAGGTATITRDSDGVELGEVAEDEAPAPRPAPRFEGRVLNRREQGRGRALLWLVWIVVALAIIALVVLLATGMIGGGLSAAPALSAVLLPRIAPAPNPHQEETAA